MVSDGIDVFKAGLIFSLVPLGLALLLQEFYRRHPKNYVKMWSYYWLGLTGYSLFASIGFVAQHDVPFLSIRRLVPALLTSQFAFLSLVYLILGVFELSMRRPPRQTHRKILFLSAAVLGGLGSVWLMTLAPNEALVHFGFVAIHTVVFAGVHIFCAIFVVRTSDRKGASWLLLVTLFVLVAGFELTRLLLEVGWMNELPVDQHSSTVLAFVVFLEGMMALGMIITLLDDEREAAMLAASQVEHMAYHDELTGLPNRSLFFDRLVMATHAAGRREQTFSVFFLDIDQFKDVNDSLGHSSGDALLRVAADRIRGALRQEDTVARFGGDEFVAIVHGTNQAEDAVKVAHKILESMRKPFTAYGREIVISCSIGMAIFPEDGDNAETLVRNADTAMYRAKDEGRDRYRLYTQSMNEHAVERFELEMDLRRAIERDELRLFMQPVIDARAKKIRGYEALIRWEHPEHGLLYPDSFLAIAERNGQIVDIGRWVINRVCEIVGGWPSDFASVIVSVNLSPSELLAPDLVSWLKSRMETCELDPGRIEIEITETAAFRDEQRTVDVLKSIKALGMRIAIDDFGTGFSSLTYVRNFPIDTLKLDQMFLRDLESGRDATITSAVISLAHGIGLEVVAEGVERESQRDFLNSVNCDALQGYLFSYPIDANEIVDKKWSFEL